jgi:hypothetical protein
VQLWNSVHLCLKLAALLLALPLFLNRSASIHEHSTHTHTHTTYLSPSRHLEFQQAQQTCSKLRE